MRFEWHGNFCYKAIDIDPIVYNSDGGNAINESDNEDKFFKWVVADEDKSFYTACQKNAKTFIRFFGGSIEMQPATPFRNNDSGLWKFTVGDLF